MHTVLGSSSSSDLLTHFKDSHSCDWDFENLNEKGHGNRPSKRVACTYVCWIPEKKNYEACLLLRRVLQPLNFLDAQNLITHAFIFPKEKPQTSTETPKKKQIIF
jgi:hypothetical protein